MAPASARNLVGNKPSPEALANRAAGRAAAASRRVAARQALVNPPAPTLISETHLTEYQYAAAVNRDIRTIRRHRALRIGPPWVKLGRSIFYPKAGVLEYLADQTVMPCRPRRGRAHAA